MSFVLMAAILCVALHLQIFLQIQLQEETLEKDQAGLVNTSFTSASPSICSLPGPPTHPELERCHAIWNNSLFCTDVLVMSFLNKRFAIEPELCVSFCFFEKAKCQSQRFSNCWFCKRLSSCTRRIKFYANNTFHCVFLSI